jgi:hypothetical protein
MTKADLLLALLKIFFNHPEKAFSHSDLVELLQHHGEEVCTGKQHKSACRRVANAMEGLLQRFHDVGLEEAPGSNERLRQYRLKNTNLVSALKGQPEQQLLKLLQMRISASQWMELQQLISEPERVNSIFRNRLFIAPDTVLLRAEEKTEVVTQLYQAILQQRSVQLQYRKANANTDQVLHFTPWGFMFKGENSYLVGKIAGKSTHVTLPVHRISAATLMDDRLNNPDLFDEKQSFERFCQQEGVGVFASGDENIEVVHLRFYKSGGHLFENKLSEDQELQYLTGSACSQPQPEESAGAPRPKVRRMDTKFWIRSGGTGTTKLTPENAG